MKRIMFSHLWMHLILLELKYIFADSKSEINRNILSHFFSFEVIKPGKAKSRSTTTAAHVFRDHMQFWLMPKHFLNFLNLVFANFYIGPYLSHKCYFQHMHVFLIIATLNCLFNAPNSWKRKIFGIQSNLSK